MILLKRAPYKPINGYQDKGTRPTHRAHHIRILGPLLPEETLHSPHGIEDVLESGRAPPTMQGYPARWFLPMNRLGAVEIVR